MILMLCDIAFFATVQTLARLKPKGIKVLGTMAMVRNSVGAGNCCSKLSLTNCLPLHKIPDKDLGLGFGMELSSQPAKT